MQGIFKRGILALLAAAGLMLAAKGAATAAAAQKNKNSFTPAALDAGFGAMESAAPTLPVDEIVRRFAAKESEFQLALERYSWRRAARIQTIDEDGNADGEYYQVDETGFDAEGKRTVKTVYAPESTLRRVTMSPADLENIQDANLFALTADEIGRYNVKYAGRQKVDEVVCYVFDVSPRTSAKKQRSFSGRIWVDAAGFEIVLTQGRMVLGNARKNAKDLQPAFMVWRQPVGGHSWFPAYAKAEGVLHFAGGRGFMAQEVHIRDTITFTDYKESKAPPRLFKIEP